MPARSVLYLRPRPGCRQALVDAFRDLDVTGRAMHQTGCLSVELHLPPEEDAPLLVTALWATRDAYDGWLNNPWRAESSATLNPLVEEEPAAGIVYDIVLAAGETSAATALRSASEGAS